jgi:hypothetical protein
MKNKEFQLWLLGFFELESEKVILSKKQIQVVKNHLNLVLEVEKKWDEKNQKIHLLISELNSGSQSSFENFTQNLKQMIISPNS